MLHIKFPILPVLLACITSVGAYTTGSITGKILSIQVRSSGYGVDYNTYVRMVVGAGQVQSFAIGYSEPMRTQLLSAALAARASGSAITLDYNVESCSFHSPDNYCTIVDIQY